ncbi:MAG: type II secretion system protein [bacterium]|nr:type II secretion system protein [bacterium]
MIKRINHQSSVISHSCGFTLIEMSLVIGIFTTLIGITFVTFLGPQLKSSLVAGKSVLLADIQSQQTKAMAGDTEASGEISSYGLFFAQNSYTLFRGDAYSETDPANKIVNLEPTLAFTEINFPSSTVVFTKGRG